MDFVKARNSCLLSGSARTRSIYNKMPIFEYNFPFSVPHFFENFLADDAKFGIDKHFTVRGDRKVNLDAWKESEDGSQMRVYR